MGDVGDTGEVLARACSPRREGDVGDPDLDFEFEPVEFEEPEDGTIDMISGGIGGTGGTSGKSKVGDC